MNTIMPANRGKCMSKRNIKGGKSIIFEGGKLTMEKFDSNKEIWKNHKMFTLQN